MVSQLSIMSKASASLPKCRCRFCGALNKNGRNRRWEFIFGTRNGGSHQFCNIMWAENDWFFSHSKTHLEQMMKDSIGEAERWDLEPKQAGLWWTSTNADEKKEDIRRRQKKGPHKFPFEKSFFLLKKKSRDASSVPREKKAKSLEEKMQSANKAWWREVKIYQRKVVPWRIEMQKMVDQVYSVFCFGSENISWSTAILDRMNGWETKVMRRLFRF